MNKIEISNPKISLINCIGTPQNYPSIKTLAIADSGANINLPKQATITIDPVMISDEITERLPYGSTIESSHILKIHLPGLIKQSRQIHSNRKMKTDPLISLGVLCDDLCTITLDK